MKVRTRFAPSPTGYLHIGGLRTALYAWLFARQNNGVFILRIEDTDQQRYVEGATDVIFQTLNEAGLTHDEGPDVGGAYGPYVQSERRNIYKEYADKLVDCGGAYYCFCTKEELDADRARAEAQGKTYRYNRKCADIPIEEARRRIANGESYVVRQRIPDTGEAAFDDMVFGHIAVDVSELEDGVLLKSDGLPTYNFANVIDDHLMGITHVLRGTEYLSSTPRYNLIYQAYGWPLPTYIHMPPVMRDAQHKLSKRDGDASYEDFIKKGYLKEAIVNYIALLGWSPGGTQEIFTLEELVQAFDIRGISKSPAIFDVQKLTWMNAEYIRRMDFDAFTAAAMPFYREVLRPEQMDLALLMRILQPRIEVFTQIPEKLAFLQTLPDYDLAMYTHKKMKTNAEIALMVVEKAREAFASLSDWTEQTLHDAVIAVAEKNALKTGQVFWCVRVAITGTEVTPGGATEAAVLLGREETLRRMEIALEKLHKN